jgi:UDP-N-acetylglucosamine acyltransferase
VLELRAAYKVLYKDGLSFEEAKLAIHAMIAKSSDQQTQEALTQFHQFLAASTRGIIR